jgi:2-amino-4-hydroxy-6-hydroxymethyldihydropteridine diphosphokinase
LRQPAAPVDWKREPCFNSLVHAVPDPPSRAYIAFGSNLGDRHARLLAARESLCTTTGIDCLAASSLYESEPSGGPGGQGLYLNAVLEIATVFAPLALLQLLQTIEKKHGRVRSERWAARTLDLDLLVYNDLILQTETLTLPHPRLHERAFVLLPCAEIAPALLHPQYGRTMLQLSDAIDLSGTWRSNQRW